MNNSLKNDDAEKEPERGVPPLPARQHEDLLFPPEAEVPSSLAQQKTSHWGWPVWIGGAILLALVYLLGYATSPLQVQEGKSIVGGIIAFAVKSTSATLDWAEQTLSPAGKRAELKHSGDTGATSTKPEQRKIKYWTDPMIPNFRSDKPGKSPMGMEMVPVYEDETISGGIRIDPTIAHNIGVRTEKIIERTLTRDIRTVARLKPDERLEMHIHTKYEGWIEKLYVNFTGQEVKQGDNLVDIYSPEMLSTQEELLSALKYKESLKDSPFVEIRKGAEELFESTKKRLELFDLPEHQIQTLITDKKISKTVHIHSPVKGFVMHKNVLHGKRVEPGMSLYTIVDLSNIWVLADVYEYELPWVRLGQEAEMTLSYHPGKTYKGKITYIDPFLNPETRTVQVRLEFANPSWDLKPDMYANVVIKSQITKRGVAVPEEAVIRSGESNSVIVKTPAGTFQSRALLLGPKAQNHYQVLQGLRAGEEVVSSSQFLIDSESKLREALRKMDKHLSTSPATAKTHDAPAATDPDKQLPTQPSKSEGSGSMEGMKQ
jgi:RND family efflux transporter MFP subunit